MWQKGTGAPPNSRCDALTDSIVRVQLNQSLDIHLQSVHSAAYCLSVLSPSDKQMVTDMLNTPTSVSFDPDGMMYICDMAHGAIRTLSPQSNSFDMHQSQNLTSLLETVCLSEEDQLSEFVREYEVPFRSCTGCSSQRMLSMTAPHPLRGSLSWVQTRWSLTTRCCTWQRLWQIVYSVSLRVLLECTT